MPRPEPGQVSERIRISADTGRPTNPNAFVISVHIPKKRLMMKPPKTVLISGIPLCLAYIAYSLTSKLAESANVTCHAY